jgi:hypothetical protein
MNHPHFFIVKRYDISKKLAVVRSEWWRIEPQILAKSDIRIQLPPPAKTSIIRHKHISIENSHHTVKIRNINIRLY